MAKSYIVTKPWGTRRIGEILPESREVRRKLAEGGCVEEFTPEMAKQRDEENKKKAEAIQKKKAAAAKNKMEQDYDADPGDKNTPKNKGAK